MKTIAIPIFGNRISPRLDYAESLQLIYIDKKKVLKRETIKIITHNRLERINRIINLQPDILICDGLTEICKNKLVKSTIKVIPWVHGDVDEVLENYMSDKLTFPKKLKNINDS